MTRLLNPGDTLAIVSPSGDAFPSRKHQPWMLQSVILKAWDLKSKLMPTTLTGLRHTPDSDKEKARDIMAAFAAPEVKAMVAAHGGASSLRILPFLDFNVTVPIPNP